MATTWTKSRSKNTHAVGKNMSILTCIVSHQNKNFGETSCSHDDGEGENSTEESFSLDAFYEQAKPMS